ncbi:MAG: uroporphyrinogen III synthase [Burkholderiales bacterium PBB4]|nr:MAG: uroporphyrinogen III synthase [Burkholderiales bacterium PBB4]
MRVIITRPPREASKWVAALLESGYKSVALPLVEVAPPSDAQAVKEAGRRLVDYDGVMFVSGNAVEHFFALNPLLNPVFCAGAAIKTRAYATGPGTVAALLRAGAEPAFIDAPGLDSPQFDSEALWAVISPTLRAGQKVLIVRGAGAQSDELRTGAGHGRDWFANQVREAGASVDYVVSYQRVPVRLQGESLDLALQASSDGSVWMFSSSEAIANLVASCPGQDWHVAKAVVTHPRIGEAACRAGFVRVSESRPSLAALLATIESMQ